MLRITNPNIDHITELSGEKQVKSMFFEIYLKKTPIFDLFHVFILSKRQALMSVTQHNSKPKSYRINCGKNLKARGPAAKDVRRSSRRNIGAKASTVNMYFLFESAQQKFSC